MPKFSTEALAPIPGIVSERCRFIRTCLISPAPDDADLYDPPPGVDLSPGDPCQRAYWLLRQLRDLARLYGGEVPRIPALSRNTLRMIQTASVVGADAPPQVYDDLLDAADRLVTWATRVQQAPTDGDSALESDRSAGGPIVPWDKLTDSEKQVWVAVKATERRVTSKQVMSIIQKTKNLLGDSTIKDALRNLVRFGWLDNNQNETPPGYGSLV
jgi:hypothetical protein